MKKIKTILFLCGIIAITAFTCEKMSEKDNYSSGKIIKHTCGGTVLQFINTDDIIGETWRNFMVQYGEPVKSYPNCVLVGNLHTFIPANELREKEGDTIFFNYRKVDFFTVGGPWCLIGGLPKTQIEISDILDSK
ncbi:MAG: hypothetical protein WC854_00560 [Bacteroidales bacterium]